MRFNFSFIFLLSILFFVSCKPDKQIELKNIISEWTNKTVNFPDGIPCSFSNRDTVSVCPTLHTASYKILLYTDSVGCTSCRFKMYLWKDFIQETDSLLPGKLNFLFYFQPQNTKELRAMLKRDRFEYPVFIDEKNEINRLNNFPANAAYQCFLLDKDNKVVAIGNPTTNPQIWELYKSIITGDKTVKAKANTTVEVVANEIELTDLQSSKTSKVSFTLKNTGDKPLLINTVDASCGCTVPLWEKQPVKPGDSTIIDVEVTPESIGYFHKTITVYCNVENDFVQLSVRGMVN